MSTSLRTVCVWTALLVFQHPNNLAAKAQYLKIDNRLATNSADAIVGATATDVFVSLYSEAAPPCFTAFLKYKGSLFLATGPRSPCVAPVSHISIMPLSSFPGAIYLPLDLTTVDPSLANFVATVESLQSPMFDTQNGSLVTSGTIQITFDPM